MGRAEPVPLTRCGAVGDHQGRLLLSEVAQTRRAIWNVASRRFVSPSRSRVNAAIGTIPLATIVVMATLPSDVSTPGGLLFAAWILTLGLLGGLLRDVLMSGVTAAFRTEHVLMAGVVVVVFPELLQGFYIAGLDLSVVKTTFLAIALFSWMVAVGSSLAPLRVPQLLVALSQREYSPRLIFRLVILCSSLFMLNIAIATNFSVSNMIAGLLGNRWSAPWGRGQLGGWEAFRDFLNNFGYVVPTLTTLLAIRYGAWFCGPVVVSLACSAITVAFVAQSGGRRLIVVMLGAALLTWLCSQHKRLKIRHLLFAVLFSLAIVVFLDIVLSNRNTGYADFSYARDDFKGLRVDDNFNSLGQTLRIIPAEADFVGFRHIWYVLVRPIPRVFWESKPTGSGFDLAGHLGQRGTALAITAIGELYMSFGWPGIVVGGCLFGWGARTWTVLLEGDHSVCGAALYGLGAMAFFAGVRSLLELVLMSYPILCWLVLDRVIVRLRQAVADSRSQRHRAYRTG
jgi:hypothetical protein